MTRPAPLSPHFPYTTLFRSSKAMQRWTRFQTSEASAQLCPSSFFQTESGRTNLDRAGHLLRMSESASNAASPSKIGRASCRESVEIAVLAVSLKMKTEVHARSVDVLRQSS